MSHYYLDCEFNGRNGGLLSLALIRGDGASIHMLLRSPLLVFDGDTLVKPGPDMDTWVLDNVWKHLLNAPVKPAVVTELEAAVMIEAFFAYDNSPHIVADWPDDIKYLCDLLITGPGTAINSPHMTFEWIRVDSYPTRLEGAVQHNAWWDAMALRHLLTTTIAQKS